MKSPIDVFSDWARDGRDEAMADGHTSSVKAMLDFSLKDQTNPFSFIDAGCGNGWVVRMVGQYSLCKSATGVDGAQSMIEKAESFDSDHTYHCSDLLDWAPHEKVDLVHSMEVFYYFANPNLLIQHITDKWLNPEGRLIMGIDYYTENKPSENWSTECDISIMTRLSIAEWVGMFIHAGLNNIQSWQVGEKDDWAGTLVVTGIK